MLYNTVIYLSIHKIKTRFIRFEFYVMEVVYVHYVSATPSTLVRPTDHTFPIKVRNTHVLNL